MKKAVLRGCTAIVALLLVFVCVAPFVLVVGSSFWEPPGGFSLNAYYDIFLKTSRYLEQFWNSMWICILIALGQIIISVFAGYGFAKYDFPGKNILFIGLMLLMVMPMQVTLVPNYLILSRMNLLGKNAALIWPNIVLPLGTFLSTQSFKAISDDVFDAAKLDGCGVFRILLLMLVPMCKGMLVCVGALAFLDGWNLVEQPSVFLNNIWDYPLSVALAYYSYENEVQHYVGCILALIPPLLLFSCFHKELTDGIVLGEVR